MMPSKENPVICWWSGGATSAVACKIAAQLWGVENCRFVMIDTFNEHPDTYRFREDCQRWYGREIESIYNEKYSSIKEVWYKFKSLNVATGAICSSELKREVRVRFQRENPFSYQVFGFDVSETNRAKSLSLNYPESRPIYPLLMFWLSEEECLEKIQEAGIEVPIPYKEGYNNNNCHQTGCVQGGIGYWQKIAREDPEKFEEMARVEHELTDLSGQPVTMLKDQSKKAKASGNVLVFLKTHPDYPELKDISMMRGVEPKPLMECNGFCGVDDLSPENLETQKELNLQAVLEL